METYTEGIGELCAQNTVEIDCEFTVVRLKWLAEWAIFTNILYLGFKKFKKPRIDVGLFEAVDAAQIGLTLKPIGLNNVNLIKGVRIFNYKIEITSSSQKIQNQLQDVMAAVESIINLVEETKRTKMFIYESDVKIHSAKEAEMTLQIKITV